MSKSIILIILFFLGCSKSNDSYYPLDEEKIWTYQISVSGFLLGNNTVKAIVTNLARRELSGKEVTPQKLDIRNQSYFTFVSEDGEGIYELGSQGPGMPEPEVRTKPNYYFRYPIKIGTEWVYETNTSLLNEKIFVTLKSTIENVNETVTVPAGTFKNCIKIKRTGIAKKKIGWNTRESKADIVHCFWYAPGVGNIKSVIEEKGDFFLAGGTMTMQLETYKD